MIDSKKIRKEYFEPAFLICVIVLGVACFAMPRIIGGLGVYLEKEPLAISKSLELLAGEKLGGYDIDFKEKIGNKAIVESLGTEEYIQWTLVDTDVEADSPVRYCTLFITYYDSPDRVPHVPEECYTGGGYQKIASEGFSVKYSEEEPSLTIPVRRVVFDSTKKSLWQNDTKFSVMYFFNVNGVYCNSREDARFVINRNVLSKQLFFSKVEWKFFGKDRFGGFAYPKKEDIEAASEKLLKAFVCKLENEHWPQIETK
ncbi:MAG: hypothetical protein H8D47_02550 [Planctomycetes bacterium]|nr:hypothetical protein [Planctomycetota bacterium]MBL7106369.1 hypothetical protein [Phycisphaerae bacterium]